MTLPPVPSAAAPIDFDSIESDLREYDAAVKTFGETTDNDERTRCMIRAVELFGKGNAAEVMRQLLARIPR